MAVKFWAQPRGWRHLISEGSLDLEVDDLIRSPLIIIITVTTQNDSPPLLSLSLSSSPDRVAAARARAPPFGIVAVVGIAEADGHVRDARELLDRVLDDLRRRGCGGGGRGGGDAPRASVKKMAACAGIGEKNGRSVDAATRNSRRGRRRRDVEPSRSGPLAPLARAAPPPTTRQTARRTTENAAAATRETQHAAPRETQHDTRRGAETTQTSGGLTAGVGSTDGPRDRRARQCSPPTRRGRRARICHSQHSTRASAPPWSRTRRRGSRWSR